MKALTKKIKGLDRKDLIFGVGLCTAVALGIFSPDTFALAAEDSLPELRDVVATSEKMVKTFSYIIGCASGCLGAYKFTASQNLGVGATAAVVSITSFKFPALITATMVI